MLLENAGYSSVTSDVLNITSSTQTITGFIDSVGISGNGNVQVLSDSGQVLHGSTNANISDATIDKIPDAGTYQIQIDPYDVVTTANNLTVSGIPSSNEADTSSDSIKDDILTNFTNTQESLPPNNNYNRDNISPSNRGNASSEQDLTNWTSEAANPIVPAIVSSNKSAIASFISFSVTDASGDNSLDTVFSGGAIRVSYELANGESVSKVDLEVVEFDSIVGSLGSWTANKLSNNLINLANFSNLSEGEYLVRAIATTTSGQKIFSTFQPLGILPWNKSVGTFTGDTLNYSNVPGEAAVFLGRGGTDTLNLAGISRADVTSINGTNLSGFNPLSNSTAFQAIFQGTAFDYLTLADGGEIYFQGIENLKFADGSNLELQVRPNDTNFAYQWNLHVSDVDSAWRFTQGANNVLLASLDTGILTAAGASGSIFDIAPARLITDPTDDDNFDGTINYGHGHSAISIMSSTANDNFGIAGINWNGKVYVNDVYRGVDLLQAIGDTINYARANNMRVVFQAGIQGDYWLDYSGGTRQQLEQLIQNNSDIALFAVGAGNGGPSGNFPDPNYLTSVNGLARLETTHSNVMSVGALETKADVNGLRQWQYEWVNGLLNAKVAEIASYSNRGSNLTLIAATDSPAIDKYGNFNYFRGTSASNPNLAGISSLVWSVNPNLNAGQVRQILTDTAMDLGAAGRDNTFGSGLVNADAAVRRAWALQNSSDVANLYGGNSLLV
ncbi:MAG TPA: serine protease [Cyanobacteria bacterium UBA11369]|nr:serine protease [Cyanobacteria bacterium UBA11371]HBE30185.1 serine protease [Cyanobacteria bacterium UBA11368]HBE48082.1 serine protease [Cyanobacteria bacterium UBA11369]